MGTILQISLLCFLVSVYASTIPKSYDTIIVGLGAAGVTAASTLAKAGKRVLALEGQDRIGGRVKTVPFGDGVVEEGAEWIHGTNYSRIYESAVTHNISVFPQTQDFVVYNSDGTPGNTSLISDLYEQSGSIEIVPAEKPEALGDYITRSHDTKHDIEFHHPPRNGSRYEVLICAYRGMWEIQRKAKEIILLDYIKENHAEVQKDEAFLNETLEMLNILISNDIASNDWNDISAQSHYRDIDGNLATTWHRHGYKTFFDIILNKYNNGPGYPNLDIKLNKEVIEIKWPRNSIGSVEVICKDGDVYIADNVVVTVSLGVLKERYASLFSPSLPQEKTQAIDKVVIGLIGKIIFSFRERWMREESYKLFYLPGDKEKFGNDTWLTKIRDVSTPAGSSNTVTLWTCGENTKFVESLPEDVVKNKSMELLRQFLGKDMKIPEPTGMIRSTWYSNPFTRGTYTFDGLVVHEYPNARVVLGKPLVDAEGNPKVLFAGEATDVIHFATVHGASDSGHREAMRILNSSKA